MGLPPTRLRAAIEAFLAHLSVERQLRPRSLEAYECDLRQLERFCTRRRLRWAGQIEPAHLTEFLQELARAGRRVASQARMRISIRQLFLYLQRQQRLGDSPAADLPAPRQVRVLPRVVGEAEAERLMHSQSGQTPRALRDRAALELLYGCGLRVSELCQLRLQDIHLERQLLQAAGKGQKDRLVPMGRPALEALQQYLLRGRPALLRGRPSQAIFVGQGGRAISRMAIYNMVRRSGIQAAIGQPLSPHTLRHAFATHLVRGGADLRSVQQLLGHACISTTEIYTQVVTDELQLAVQRHHPLGSEAALVGARRAPLSGPGARDGDAPAEVR